MALDVLRRDFARGLDPVRLIERVHAAIMREGRDTAWILLRDLDAVRADAVALMQRDPQRELPLHGVPFAVKDNIDVAGLTTTAGCPQFGYVPGRSATAVERLVTAGALLIGKTNLDQFATGLVGTRSPYGAVPNPFDAEYISGGSSSGSASVVARGLVSFALGTDTAGSGRVPAGFCNVVGLKPTRGRVSMAGVVPACRSLDCVSVFALTVPDAAEVLRILTGADPADPYLRVGGDSPLAAVRTLGVPARPEFFGDRLQQQAFRAAVDRAEALGLTVSSVDFTPLLEAARLLYDGPFVAERYVAIREFYTRSPEALDPTVRAILSDSTRYTAADVFEAQYRLAELKQACDAIFADVDALLVPTAPTIYRIDQVRSDPLLLNARLGHYTNFVNLLDLAAIAVPDRFRADGLPFGVTLIGPAWSEAALADLAARWHEASRLPLGATGCVRRPDRNQTAKLPTGAVDLAVVGAHLSGMPLNHQLTERRAVRVASTTTSPRYRLFALQNTSPPKPGLLRTQSGAPIEVELWRMPLGTFGSFVAAVPPPLAIGSLELADGSWVKGFVCEAHAIENATDITEFGGWRAYMLRMAHR